MAGTPPTDVPVHPVYAEALERQLETMRFMRQRRPFDYVAKHIAREYGLPFTKPGAGEELDDIVADALERAAPHFWTRHMGDLLGQTADTLPTGPTDDGRPGWVLKATDLAVPAGYLWFQDPLEITAGLNDVADTERLTALLWTPVARRPTIGGANFNRDPRGDAGYMVVPFTMFEGRDNGALINVRHGTPRTPLHWRIGESVGQFEQDLAQMYQDATYRSSVRLIAGMPASFHAQQMVRFGRLFATAVALMNQTLLVESAPYRGDRASRRRAQALAGRPILPDEALVRTVMLRRREYVNKPSGDHDPVDWQYRWTVRPHWRNQWYPSENRHKPVLIGSYVKGPPDKPLKVSTPLFVVSR